MLTNQMLWFCVSGRFLVKISCKVDPTLCWQPHVSRPDLKTTQTPSRALTLRFTRGRPLAWKQTGGWHQMKVMTRGKYTERDYRRAGTMFSVLRCQSVQLVIVTLRPKLACRKQTTEPASGKTLTSFWMENVQLVFYHKIKIQKITIRQIQAH